MKRLESTTLGTASYLGCACATPATQRSGLHGLVDLSLKRALAHRGCQLRHGHRHRPPLQPLVWLRGVLSGALRRGLAEHRRRCGGRGCRRGLHRRAWGAPQHASKSTILRWVGAGAGGAGLLAQHVHGALKVRHRVLEVGGGGGKVGGRASERDAAHACLSEN